MQALPSVLGDDRFKVMFENPDYQVDEQSIEFRLLNPIVSKVGEKKQKKLRLMAQQVAASKKVTHGWQCPRRQMHVRPNGFIGSPVGTKVHKHGKNVPNCTV